MTEAVKTRFSNFYRQSLLWLPMTMKPMMQPPGMCLSRDGKYIFCANAGEDTVAMFKRDEETGLLKKQCILPISGNYPKDLDVFPDGKHLGSGEP